MASFYNYYYPYHKPHFTNPAKVSDFDKKETFAEAATKQQKKSSKPFSFGPLHFKNPIFSDLEDPIFEIFGIQLYLDDIIILGLLFFLYQEGVQDEMLYIALILLLIG